MWYAWESCRRLEGPDGNQPEGHDADPKEEITSINMDLDILVFDVYFRINS